MASTAAMPPPGAAPQAVFVDVHTIHAQGGAHDEESTDGTLRSVGPHTMGDHFRTVLRNYFMSCVPPHIRRKGLAVPPVRVRTHSGWWSCLVDWKDQVAISTL